MNKRVINKFPDLFSKTFIILFGFVVLGFLFRVIGLSSFPNGFARDEAYLGYNAYSLLLTAKDINGNFLPIFIESFLYTPAGYAYLSIPFIKLFGLNIFSVRIASALAGVATIPLMFFLTKQIFSIEKKDAFSQKAVFAIGILSSFLLTVNPWHINLSRTASVSTVILLLITLSLYFIFRWIQVRNFKWIIVAFLFLFISLLFYIAPYSFIPFLLILFFAVYRSKFKDKMKVFLVFFALLLIPITFTYLHKDFSLRVQSLSLTHNALVPIVLTENASRDGVEGLHPILSRAFHNKVTVISDLYIQNYFQHLSFSFLFSDKGFPDRYRIPEAGLLFSILLPAILIGVFILLKTKTYAGLFLVGWILVSPLGSAFTGDDVPNMQRILFMLPPILIFAGVGCWELFININSLFKKFVVCILALIFVYQALFYFHQYYIHENSYRPWYRQEGYQQLALSLNQYDSFSRIVVTNRESAPTLLLSFFMKYDPKLLQEAIQKSSITDTDRISFGKYEITQEECPLTTLDDGKTGKERVRGEKGVLYVNSGFCKHEDLPKNATIHETIRRSDNSPVFYLVSLK